jgi:tRNA-splicing ligase RtcB
MAPKEVAPKLLVWGAEEIEPGTIRQAGKAARLSFVPDHVALMPDAHVGIGATVGSVIPTEGAIIPAAVGVDIGCGMAALETGLRADQLPDDLKAVLDGIEGAVPAGLGKGRHSDSTVQLPATLKEQASFRHMDQKLRAISANQLCTLGSGNHFIEISLDENDSVWIVLHSGSRGVGNKLANEHIRVAKGLMRDWFIKLEDEDLAYLVEGTPQFEAYIADMLWAQDYAAENRRTMLSNVSGCSVVMHRRRDSASSSTVTTISRARNTTSGARSG